MGALEAVQLKPVLEDFIARIEALVGQAEGEAKAQVEAEKAKVRLEATGSGREMPAFAELPETFRDLVERALKLETRIALLDRQIYGEVDIETSHDPVGEQLKLLRTAFSA